VSRGGGSGDSSINPALYSDHQSDKDVNNNLRAGSLSVSFVGFVEWVGMYEVSCVERGVARKVRRRFNEFKCLYEKLVCFVCLFWNLFNSSI
jgi:hypothetical protein